MSQSYSCDDLIGPETAARVLDGLSKTSRVHCLVMIASSSVLFAETISTIFYSYCDVVSR